VTSTASTGTVCITFDFDAFSSRLSNGGPTGPGALSRGEFSAFAVPRLLALLARENVPATWFVPGHTAETFPDLCRQIAADGHELGLHGYLHEPVSALGPDGERAVLERARDALAKVTGSFPVGNRTPVFDFSESTADILLAAGVTYDSSLMARDYQPYRVRAGDRQRSDGPFEFGAETTLIELGVDWSLCDFGYFEYMFASGVLLQGLRKVDDVIDNWVDELRYMTRDVADGVVTITLHPEVMGRGHRLLGLERFIAEARDLGVEFARQDTVATAVAAGRRYGAGC